MKEAVKKNSVTYGIIVGVLAILVYTVMYVIDVKLFANIWIGVGLGILNIVIGIIAVAKAKKALAGFISFKDAFTVFFLAMAIGALIGTIYLAILLNVIDPAAQTIILDEYVTMTVNWMQQAGSKPAEIKKTIEDMKASDPFGPVTMALSYVKGLLFYIIIGLIVAAAMKKNNEAYN
jgi:hypothetical protein